MTAWMEKVCERFSFCPLLLFRPFPAGMGTHVEEAGTRHCRNEGYTSRLGQREALFISIACSLPVLSLADGSRRSRPANLHIRCRRVAGVSLFVEDLGLLVDGDKVSDSTHNYSRRESWCFALAGWRAGPISRDLKDVHLDLSHAASSPRPCGNCRRPRRHWRALRGVPFRDNARLPARAMGLTRIRSGASDAVREGPA